MEAYEIFKIKDDMPEDYIDPNRQLMDQLLARADGMLKGNMTDIASKIKAELLMGHCFFGSRNDAVDAFITAASAYYKALSIADQRNTDATLRDIIETFGEEIKTGDKQYMDILDEYLPLLRDDQLLVMRSTLFPGTIRLIGNLLERNGCGTRLWWKCPTPCNIRSGFQARRNGIEAPGCR